MALHGEVSALRKRNVVDQEKLQWNQQAMDNRQHNVSPSQKTAMPRWRSKGKEKSSIALACTWIVEHQIGIAVNLISILFFVHIFIPSARHHTSKFFRISYYNPISGTFALGWDDICFVLYWIIVFTGMRCAVMDYLLTPLAAWAGIDKKKEKVRFAEQAWILLYYGLFWSTGMYIMYTSDYWLDLHALWRNWPIREMDGLAKWYYLVQFAFWLQQIVVVNIEERRKDHWQMFTHHMITCTLIFASYGYHQTKVGTLILCLMDVVDLFLPAAKILKYLDFKLACDVAFGVFMVTWVVARHVFYMWVCWSIYAHIPQEIRYGCYKGSVANLKGPLPIPNDWDHLTQPFRDPVGLVCWNNNIKWTFLSMLLALQCVLLVWFVMIIRVAYKVLSGTGADDIRSDDEEDEEEEVEEYPKEKDSKSSNYVNQIHTCVEPQPFVEKELSGPNTSAHLPTTRSASNSASSSSGSAGTPSSKKAKSPPASVRRSSRRKPEGANSSAVNLLAGKDRKDFLGRIGCDHTISD